jgi:hypothetical protein
MGEGAHGVFNLAGDVIAAGTALAGLILVYLGSVVAGYERFDKPQQPSVRPIYQRRAWFAVAGIVFSIGASGTAVLGEWLANSDMANASIVILALALIWAVITAFLIASEVT